MKNIAEKLAKASKDYIKPIIGGKGDIYIKSDPSAAIVFINGKPTGKTTPTTIRDLDTGEHLVKVVKGELVGSKLLRINTNDITEIDIQLGKAKGGLKVYSSPVEADIFLGDNFFGRTPKVINDLALGDHLVTLKKSEYLDVTKNVTITAGDYQTIEGNLVKPAELRISSIPNNANIKINGEFIGATPVTLDSLYPKKFI